MATRRARKCSISLETREQIRRLTLMDNAFMNIALEGNIPCVEEMLRVILSKDDLIVKSVQTQKMYQGFLRSVCLDIYAEDSKGTLYNVELQQVSEGADPRRARFHGAMMDSHALKAGQDFRKLPERYVIFITREDVLGRGKLIYTIHKYIDGDLLPFDDGSHTIYINGAAEDDGTELWKLVHDLKCANPDEMFFPRLAARAKFLKGDEEGVVIVSNYFEEREKKAAERAAEKAAEKAEKQGRKKAQENIALKLITLGEVTLEKIADCTGLTLTRVKALAKAGAA